MAKVCQPSGALPCHIHGHIGLAAESCHSHGPTSLPSSKPSASRDQKAMREPKCNHGKHNQDLEHAAEGPSILRMRAAFLLELENTHLPAKTLRLLEHRISPCTPGPSSFPDTGYHEFKIAEGDSRLRKCFLRQLEITNLDPNKLNCIEKRINPPRPGPFIGKVPSKPLAALTSTMDPQEESSSAASRRESDSHRCEDPRTEDTIQGRYSDVSTSTNASDSRALSFKGPPTTRICKIHEFCYSSQYTRPATELLTEVLEERYPVPETDGNGGEEQGRSGLKCGWMRTLVGYLRWT